MQQESLGTIKISDDVITVCAARAVSAIDGVYQLAGGLTDSLPINLPVLDSAARGIKVSRGDEGLVLDIYVIVEYMVKIPQLAWDIQGTVKREIEEMTDLKVCEVNIHVQGVHLPEEDE